MNELVDLSPFFIVNLFQTSHAELLRQIRGITVREKIGGKMVYLMLK
jgi:hypothetical protein